MFFLGDNVVVGGIRQFVERFQARKDHCHLVLARVREPQRFGVAEVRGNRIVRVVEKPTQPPSDFAVTGIYVYDTPIFEAVHAIRPAPAASWRSRMRINTSSSTAIRWGFGDHRLVEGHREAGGSAGGEPVRPGSSAGRRRARRPGRGGRRE